MNGEVRLVFIADVRQVLAIRRRYACWLEMSQALRLKLPLSDDSNSQIIVATRPRSTALPSPPATPPTPPRGMTVAHSSARALALHRLSSSNGPPAAVHTSGIEPIWFSIDVRSGCVQRRRRRRCRRIATSEQPHA